MTHRINLEGIVRVVRLSLAQLSALTHLITLLITNIKVEGMRIQMLLRDQALLYQVVEVIILVEALRGNSKQVYQKKKLAKTEIANWTATMAEQFKIGLRKLQIHQK